MDRFVYNYHTLGSERSNRLSYVTDNGTDYSAYDDIKSGQATGNYTYNKIGELVSDASEDMELEWRTGDHKLLRVIRTDDASPNLTFMYNPFGQRIMKIATERANGNPTEMEGILIWDSIMQTKVMLQGIGDWKVSLLVH